MQNSSIRCLTGFACCCLTFLTMTSPAAPAPASRHIDLDVAKAAKPLDNRDVQLGNPDVCWTDSHALDAKPVRHFMREFCMLISFVNPYGLMPY